MLPVYLEQAECHLAVEPCCSCSAPHHRTPSSDTVRGTSCAQDHEALSGVDTMLMVSASETADRVQQHYTFIYAAARAEVGHLVYVSTFGASPTATLTLARDHWATEEHIKASGLAYTFLRDNLYADFFAAMVGDDDVSRGPTGQGRVAAVVQDDIADVAAVVLQQPREHAGASYDLTGPQALTLDQVASTITEITGRPVTYHPETVQEVLEQFSDGWVWSTDLAEHQRVGPDRCRQWFTRWRRRRLGLREIGCDHAPGFWGALPP
jgi:NAD(P)H dehydrogenase (quinone)